MKLQKENNIEFLLEAGDLYGRIRLNLDEPQGWVWKYVVQSEPILFLYDLNNRITDSYGSSVIQLDNRIVIRDSTIHYYTGKVGFFNALKNLATKENK